MKNLESEDFNPKEPFYLDILSLQPSQLYINRDKLEKIKELAREKGLVALQPLPIKKLHNKIILTDGHTRAYFLYTSAIQSVLVEWDDPWDTEFLDKKMYQACVNWCIDEEIMSVKDLQMRIISNNDYQKLWIDKCRQLEKETYNK